MRQMTIIVLCILLFFAGQVFAHVWKDDFEEDSIGKDWTPATWRVNAPPNWKVEDGILKGSWLHSDAAQMLFLEEYPSLDYTIQVRFRIDRVWQASQYAGPGIVGALLMIDGKTPHVAVPVQALVAQLSLPVEDSSVHRPIATTLSDESGKYRFINLKPGRYQVRCQVLGGFVYYPENRVSSDSNPPSPPFTKGGSNFDPFTKGGSNFDPFTKGGGNFDPFTKGGGNFDPFTKGGGNFDPPFTKGGKGGFSGLLRVERGKTTKSIDFRFAPFKKGTWRNYDTIDGLGFNAVKDIYRDPDGVIWFATEGGGVSRYDGKEFVNLTAKDGLAHNTVYTIHRDPDGVMWFGTWGGGVSRYDGKEFVNLTTEDGLAHNNVWSIHRDPDGGMWFGTDGGGVSYYDGVAWTLLDTRDGLAGNSVLSIYQDSEGSLWFGTEGGLTRYRRSTVPPKAHIVSVTTGRTYRDLSAIPAFGIGTRVTIQYDSVDFKTVPGKRQYRCLINEVGARHASPLQWRKPTKATSFDYTFKKACTYAFEVQAIDRDLNYSEPASLEINILPPPFYTRAGFIGGSIFAALLIPSVIYAVLLARHKRQELFEPIPNPYMAGGPVRSQEMFFGREEDFMFVSNRLKTEKEGIVIVFYGQRRSGKTSLLHQILNGRLGADFMPVMIDMQEMAVNSDGEFYEKIADEVSFGLSELLDVDSTEYDFRAEDANPALVFERFIDDVMEKSDGKVLLLMFDEYELFEEKMDDGIIRSDTPTFLAGILERRPGISFVFTGSRHIDQRNPQYWRTLLGKSTARRISLLSEQDTLRLIREPVADAVRYQKAVPQRIYRLTGGQPFYTQHVCQLLIESLNNLERNRVYADDVEKTALELVDNPPPQMMYFWSEELSSKEKLALVLLGRILNRSDDYASAGMVAEYAASREEDIKLEAPEIAGILDGLCQYELLERERVSEEIYEYRYKIDLFRYWVQRHQSIAQVMREMNAPGDE